VTVDGDADLEATETESKARWPTSRTAAAAWAMITVRMFPRPCAQTIRSFPTRNARSCAQPFPKPHSSSVVDLISP